MAVPAALSRNFILVPSVSMPAPSTTTVSPALRPARISISPSRDILQSAARGQLPGRFELLLGYAGWAAKQLEHELERGSWLHAPFDAELLFDVPLDDRWDETYKRLGLAPYAFQNVRGGAQA